MARIKNYSLVRDTRITILKDEDEVRVTPTLGGLIFH